MCPVQRCCETQVENLVFQSWASTSKYSGSQCRWHRKQNEFLRSSSWKQIWSYSTPFFPLPIIFGVTRALVLPLKHAQSHLLSPSLLRSSSLSVHNQPPPRSFTRRSPSPFPLQPSRELPARLPPPAAPSCQVVESPSEAAVAAGIPCWQRAPPGFTQRTKTQSLLVHARLRSSSDNIATNYNFASSLNQFPLFPMKRAGSSEVPPSGM